MRRKLLSIVTVLLLAIVIVACGGNDSGSIDPNSPTGVTTEFLNAIKAEDNERIEKVYAGDNMDMEETMDFSGSDTDDLEKEIYEGLMAKILDFDFEVSNEKIDGDKATVDVKITQYNLADVFTKFMQDFMGKAMEMAIADASEDEIVKESVNVFNETLKNAKKDYEKTVKFNLIKDGDSWKVEKMPDDGDFMNALTGGLLEWINEIGGLGEAMN